MAVSNRAPPDDIHFMDEDHDGHTLCGLRWDVIVWSNNKRARCVACQDVWRTRTGWAFPLPDLVTFDIP
jgi:hypothetical protein